MKLFNHVLETSFNSRHKWSHFKIHKRDYYKHLVWGKLSILWGQPHLEPVTVCAHCNEQISGIGAGDESLNYCESCQLTEGETKTITTEEYEGLH